MVGIAPDMYIIRVNIFYYDFHLWYKYVKKMQDLDRGYNSLGLCRDGLHRPIITSSEMSWNYQLSSRVEAVLYLLINYCIYTISMHLATILARRHRTPYQYRTRDEQYRSARGSCNSLRRDRLTKRVPRLYLMVPRPT